MAWKPYWVPDGMYSPEALNIWKREEKKNLLYKIKKIIRNCLLIGIGGNI